MEAPRVTSDIKSPGVHYNVPSKNWRFIDFRELWAYRRLLLFLSWRDLQVRYKQTVLGLAWAVISPLITMVVFTFVFHRLANVASYNIPYPVFSYSGLIVWGLFSKGLAGVSASVVRDATLLTRVYFPRIISPLSKLAVGIVDFFIASFALAVLMIIFKITPTHNIVFLPIFFILALTTALGVGMWLAALNIRYRDVAQFVPFMVQIWMYLSPVPYPSELLSEPWRTLYGLNPMVSALDGFRWALLGTHSVHLPALALSVITATVMLISGVYIFRRSEKTLVDYV